MKAKKKNSKSNVSEFLRYIRGEMTKREEHAFQKELQKDPFAEEAEEGFSQITAKTAESDVTTLQKRLDGRVKRRPNVVFYRIAASVTVLLVISTILFLNRGNDHFVTLSENLSEEKISPAIIEESEPIKGPDISEPDLKEEISPSQEMVKSEDLPDANEEIVQETEELYVAASMDQAVNDTVVSEPEIVAEVAYMAEARSADRGKSISMVRVASTPESAKSGVPGNYNPPQPIIGQDSFNIYLEKNIRIPESEKSEPQITVINFKILTDSTLADIRIISSPGEAYSTESVRLIKEGPVWIPAEEDGMKKEDEVTLTIVFR